MSPQPSQQAPTDQTAGTPGSTPGHTLAEFGPNEWLVDEIYQQFLRDPESVDRAWWDFFNDYQPTDSSAAAQALAPVAKVDNPEVTVTSDTAVPAAAAAPTAAVVPAPAPAPAATPAPAALAAAAAL
ncbi:2-oxoglutarate dehydrogenase E1 subunit family protein, partial [Catenulispora yoronensis]|uniref:2-oxoglutarate dehydrogenase E1 subunit family protein n=1 Tax=Catenulispora yoronensis TaxID=450799 RepID=UPI0031D73B1E